MISTIDGAGRVVIPKALRTALGLRAGQALEIRAVQGKIEIEVAATPMTLEKHDAALVAVAGREMPRLTAAEVREALETVRQ
jgi:AbrB family looped-hinge helix DNA binding protein